MNVGLRKLLTIPIMNPSMNNSFYSKCLFTFAPSAAMARTDWRSSGMNVRPRTQLFRLMILTISPSLNNSQLLGLLRQQREPAQNLLGWILGQESCSQYPSWIHQWITVFTLKKFLFFTSMPSAPITRTVSSSNGKIRGLIKPPSHNLKLFLLQ